MNINVEKVGNVNVYYIDGRLDSNTAGSLEKKLIPAINPEGKQFVLDFSELEYISSAGLRVLLQAAKMLNQISGALVLCSVKDEIKEVFDIAGLSPIFPTYIDLDDAINNI